MRNIFLLLSVFLVGHCNGASSDQDSFRNIRQEEMVEKFENPAAHATELANTRQPHEILSDQEKTDLIKSMYLLCLEKKYEGFIETWQKHKESFPLRTEEPLIRRYLFDQLAIELLSQPDPLAYLTAKQNRKKISALMRSLFQKKQYEEFIETWQQHKESFPLGTSDPAIKSELGQLAIKLLDQPDPLAYLTAEQNRREISALMSSLFQKKQYEKFIKTWQKHKESFPLGTSEPEIVIGLELSAIELLNHPDPFTYIAVKTEQATIIEKINALDPSLSVDRYRKELVKLWKNKGQSQFPRESELFEFGMGGVSLNQKPEKELKRYFFYRDI
jgi:tetratricopeptide (TPR) repeat protein